MDALGTGGDNTVSWLDQENDSRTSSHKNGPGGGCREEVENTKLSTKMKYGIKTTIAKTMVVIPDCRMGSVASGGCRVFVFELYRLDWSYLTPQDLAR